MPVELNEIERKTVYLALEALPFREIGRVTQTSEQVVKNRMSQIYQKTGAGGIVELVLMVLSHPEWIGGKACGGCGRLR